ncbi:MAG: anti-sigma factor family protein [Longimicrobiales bacterium]
MSATDIRSCEDALRQLAAYIDHELHGSARRELEQHLATCRSCFSRAEFERRLKAHVASLAEARVRPELATRVLRLIEGFSVTRAE